MPSVRTACLALLVTAVACASAWGGPQRRRKEAPSAVLPSNTLPARLPPPSSDGVSDGQRPSQPLSRSLLSWLNYELLLVGLGGLAVLVLLIVLISRRGRHLQSAPKVPAVRPPPAERAQRQETAATARTGKKGKGSQPAVLREESVVVELRPEQTLLLARDQDAPSLYDILLALGPDQLALRCFRRAAAENLDSLTWATTVKDGGADRIARLATTWRRQVALERVATWLRAHPLVQRSGLEVQVPGTLEPQDLANLTLTQPDGLGVTLPRDKAALFEQARAALRRAFSDQPLALLAASTDLDALLSKELQAELEQGYRPHALPLLVGGSRALDWAAHVGLGQAGLGAEYRDALREHAKLVGTPVPADGPVAHALEVLGEERMDGVGLLLAAVAGAAFSSSTVILRISKCVGQIKPGPALAALSQLGKQASASLDDEQSHDRSALQENLRFLLGIPLLERERERAAVLLKEAERLAVREPLWKSTAGSATCPGLALATLHDMQLTLAVNRAEQAHQRLLELIDRLAHPGGTENQVIGYPRLGYVLVGLGAPLVRNTSTELLSALREATAELLNA